MPVGIEPMVRCAPAPPRSCRGRAALGVLASTGSWSVSGRSCDPPPESRTPLSLSSRPAPTTSTTWTTKSSPESRRHPGRASRGRARPRRVPSTQAQRAPARHRLRAHRGWKDLRLFPGPSSPRHRGRSGPSSPPTSASPTTRESLSLYSGHDPIYLGEEPVLENAETFSLAVEDDYRVMDRFDELVIKSRSGWVARTSS